MTHTVHGKPVAPVLGALLLAACAFALAQTMVVPALPHIAEEYGTTSASSSWVLTGFLLSAAVCTPLAGKLGDVFGKGRMLTAVLVIFATGALISALSGSIGVLIAGRVIQGAAGGVFPLAFGIVNDELPGEKRAVAIGLISAMFGIGGGIGLPLSGVIVDNAHLSWLFLTGLMALPAAAAAWFYIPPSPARTRTTIDWTGAAVLSTGLVAILFALTKANVWGWGSPGFLGLVAAGLAALGAFVALELRTAEPLIDMRVLRRRPVLATNATGFLVGVAMFGSFLLVPQFAQAPESTGYGFGMSVTSAGLVMLPSALTMLFAGPLAGLIGNRIGFRAVLAMGAALAAASFGLLAVAHEHVWHFMASGVLVGAGISFAFGAMANLIVVSVDARDVGIATGINTVTRSVGGAFGSALVTALLTADTIGSTGLPTGHAYTEAFTLSGLVGCVALAVALAIPRPARAARAPVPATAQA